MSRVILYMAMSLDGFITGPGDDKGNPAGVGGMRLMEWLGAGGPEVADWRPSDPQSQIVFDEMLSTVKGVKTLIQIRMVWQCCDVGRIRDGSPPLPVRSRLGSWAGLLLAGLY